MKITILAVGRLKERGGFREMERFYRERLSPLVNLTVVELREGKSVAEETALIVRRIPLGSFIVALREEGECLDSRAFAALIARHRDRARDMTFIVGGAYGFGKIGEHLALSVAPWTLNHFLARIVLWEQLYRAFSLLGGRPYHHG